MIRLFSVVVDGPSKKHWTTLLEHIDSLCEVLIELCERQVKMSSMMDAADGVDTSILGPEAESSLDFEWKTGLIAHYEQNAQRNEFDLFDFDQPWFQTAFIGARLEIPIFDGFQKRAGVERAKLQLEGISLQQETLSRQLELQAAQSRTNYENATDRLVSLQKSRDLAGKIFNVTQIKYREGVGSSLELTTAQSDFEVAEDQYIAALYELLIALSDLKKAYGQY